jgi:hypothetical protein
MNCICCGKELVGRQKKMCTSQTCHRKYHAMRCLKWQKKNIEHYRKYQKKYQKEDYLKKPANLQKHKIRVLLRAALTTAEVNKKSRSAVWKFINSSPDKTIKHLTKDGKHWKTAKISNKFKRVRVKTVKAANKVFHYKNLKLI